MTLFNRLLEYYQITKDEYNDRIENDKLSAILNPFQYMEHFQRAIDLIEQHIASKDKIAVVGDYDVDGLTSTSIIVMALRKRGVDPGFYIPSRYIDGYGINKERVMDLWKAGYKLIITTDNGITAFEPIEKARSLGIDVLIVDHHTPQENNLPQANEIIHHRLCHYGNLDISAGFLALLVSFGLNKEYDEYSTALAGLAVISDMMPMRESNLALVNILMRIMRSGKYPQFNLLLCNNVNLTLPPRAITSKKISFDVVSPLNGLGRMNIGLGNNNAVRFLVSDDLNEINKYYRYIMSVSQKKKDRLRELRKLVNTPVESNIDFRVINNCEVGLIGALANNQMYSIKKPVVLFSQSPNDSNVLVGSGRSLPYIDFYRIMKKHSNLYLTFGGHRNAFGLSIYAKDFIYLRECLIREFNELKAVRPVEKYIAISIDEINFNSFDLMNTFGPFGTDFESPQFVLKINRKDLKLSHSGEHIYTRLNSEGTITYFNYDRMIDEDESAELYLGGELILNNFRNNYSIHFNVDSIVDVQKDKIIE